MTDMSGTVHPAPPTANPFANSAYTSDASGFSYPAGVYDQSTAEKSGAYPPPPPYKATEGFPEGYNTNYGPNYSAPPQYTPGQYPGYGGAPGYPAVVTQPVVYTRPQQPYTEVPDPLVLSIVSLFFCLLIGIVSVLSASRARREKEAGQYQDALKSANSARNLAITAIVIGLVLLVVNIVVRVVILQQ